jgi:hypothetical protein
MPKRKRAPGGGAKPKGPFPGKSATLTTRITPDTRAELKRSASEQNRSLSQEVEFRLRDFAKQNQRPPHIRSLADAISLLVATVELRTGKRWSNDCFTADAVQQAVSAFMLKITPQSAGQPLIPEKLERWLERLPSLREALRSPLALGELVADELMYQISNAPLNAQEAPGLTFPAPEGLSRIRRDLRIVISEEEKQ